MLRVYVCLGDVEIAAIPYRKDDIEHIGCAWICIVTDVNKMSMPTDYQCWRGNRIKSHFDWQKRVESSLVWTNALNKKELISVFSLLCGFYTSYSSFTPPVQARNVSNYSGKIFVQDFVNAEWMPASAAQYYDETWWTVERYKWHSPTATQGKTSKLTEKQPQTLSAKRSLWAFFISNNSFMK